jgi:hypothetical protein
MSQLSSTACRRPERLARAESCREYLPGHESNQNFAFARQEYGVIIGRVVYGRSKYFGGGEQCQDRAIQLFIK